MRLWGFEQRWAGEVARGFVPRGALGGTTDPLDAAALFAEDFAASPWFASIGVRLALWIVWFAPLFSRGRTWGALRLEDREQVLERLLDSDLDTVRMLVMFLKLICVAILLGNGRSLRRIGAYDLRVLP